MNWKELKEKHSHLDHEFNMLSFDNRVMVSIQGRYEAIKELERSKKHYESAILKINERMDVLSKSIEKDIKYPPTEF